MTHRVRLTLGTVLVLGLLLASTLFAARPAHAAVSYVALGDSYSSGVGTRSYISDGSSCQRSTYAYPYLVAQARGYALSFQACSGAKTANSPIAATVSSAITTSSQNPARVSSILRISTCVSRSSGTCASRSSGSATLVPVVLVAALMPRPPSRRRR